MNDVSGTAMSWRAAVRRALPAADKVVSLGRVERDKWRTRLTRVVSARSKAKIAEYVQTLANRVEPYQPLWGFPSTTFDQTSRACIDRMDTILAYANLPTWRGVRVVDLGCSLGWFCLAFRSRGAIVDGVEMNPTLVTIDRQLALFSDFRSDITFHHHRLQNYVQHVIPTRQQDMVLVLSVLHHVAHENGFEFARQLVRKLTRASTMCFFEMAVREENVDIPWVKSLPKRVEDWFEFAAEDGLEVTRLGEFGTHLSQTPRPLFAVRQNRVWVNGRAYSVNELSTAAFPGVDRAGRKFYLGDTHFVKRLDFDPGEQHRTEFHRQQPLRDQIVREIGVHVMLRDRHIANIARMVDWEITPQHGSIVFDRVPGRLLSGAFEQMQVTALRRVIIDIIGAVQRLRDSGVFHNDIRLYNIMVNDEGHGTLIDFGLAGPVEIETNSAGLQHLILAAATRTATRGEYPLAPPTPKHEQLGHFIDLFEFVASGRFHTVAVTDMFPAC
jgi:O-antigen chain-terminating methyltransferase